MERKKLSADEIEKALEDIKGWKVEGANLKKRFEYENFAESLAFVNKVGAIAEEQDHHPDIKFGWGYAEFYITTHDAGGLTARDFKLAQNIEKLNG